MNETQDKATPTAIELADILLKELTYFHRFVGTRHTVISAFHAEKRVGELITLAKDLRKELEPTNEQD